MDSSLFIGRFQPLHNGHLKVIENILAKNEHVIIGIGSSQEGHTEKNPLTLEERVLIITKTLQSKNIPSIKYKIIPIRDINNYPEWFNHLNKLVPYYTKIYTGSELVEKCYKLKYEQSDVHNLKPELVTIKKDLDISASEVRKRIANDTPWENLVPPKTAEILKTLDIKSRLTA